MHHHSQGGAFGLGRRELPCRLWPGSLAASSVCSRGQRLPPLGSLGSLGSLVCVHKNTILLQCWDGTQSFMYTRQALYQLSYISSAVCCLFVVLNFITSASVSKIEWKCLSTHDKAPSHQLVCPFFKTTPCRLVGWLSR